MSAINPTCLSVSILALLAFTCLGTSHDEDCHVETSLLQTNRTIERVNLLQASSCATSRILVLGGYTTNDDHESQIMMDQVYGLEINAPEATWEQQTSLTLPETRMAHCAFAHGSKIYVLGGWTQSMPDATAVSRSLKMFDLVDQTWSTGPSLSIKRGFSSCALLDDKIYVIGNDPLPGDTSPDPDSPNAVEILDLATMEWQAGPPLPEDGCKTGAATAHGQDVYVIGCGSPAQKSYILDTVDNTWRQGPYMLDEREDGTAQTIGDTIYWFGGYSDHHGFNWTEEEGKTDAFSLDVNTQQWSRLPSMPGGVARLSSVVYGDDIYLVSGSLKFMYALKDVTIYNIETKQYRSGPALPMNITGSAAVAVTNAAQC